MRCPFSHLPLLGHCVTSEELCVGKSIFNRKIAVDTTPLVTCLAFIDSRDDEWDLTEPDLVSTMCIYSSIRSSECNAELPSPALMSEALSLEGSVTTTAYFGEGLLVLKRIRTNSDLDSRSRFGKYDRQWVLMLFPTP